MTLPSVDEGRHFLSQTAGRREELRAEADAGASRLSKKESLARAAGTDDATIVDWLEHLGFSGDSVRVLDLLPLVHVCWADGRVQEAERKAVLALLDARGIAPDSDACLLVESLLERRPSETYLAQTLALMKALVEKSGGETSDVVDLCSKVAEASGGLLGFGNRTSDAERALIRQIAEALGGGALERFRARFGA